MLSSLSNLFIEATQDSKFKRFYEIERNPVAGLLVSPQIAFGSALLAINYFAGSTSYYEEKPSERARCWNLGCQCVLVFGNQILNIFTLGILNNVLLRAISK